MTFDDKLLIKYAQRQRLTDCPPIINQVSEPSRGGHQDATAFQRHGSASMRRDYGHRANDNDVRHGLKRPPRAVSYVRWSEPSQVGTARVLMRVQLTCSRCTPLSVR